MQVRTQDETNKGERPEIPSSCPVSRSLNTMSDITHNLDAENKQYGNIRDPILRNVAIKVGSGLAVGVALSLTIFKRKFILNTEF